MRAARDPRDRPSTPAGTPASPTVCGTASGGSSRIGPNGGGRSSTPRWVSRTAIPSPPDSSAAIPPRTTAHDQSSRCPSASQSPRGGSERGRPPVRSEFRSPAGDDGDYPDALPVPQLLVDRDGDVRTDKQMDVRREPELSHQIVPARILGQLDRPRLPSGKQLRGDAHDGTVKTGLDLSVHRAQVAKPGIAAVSKTASLTGAQVQILPWALSRGGPDGVPGTQAGGRRGGDRRGTGRPRQIQESPEVRRADRVVPPGRLPEAPRASGSGRCSDCEGADRPRPPGPEGGVRRVVRQWGVAPHLPLPGRPGAEAARSRGGEHRRHGMVRPPPAAASL